MSIPTKTIVEECPIDGNEKDIEEHVGCGGCEDCEYQGYANSFEYFCQHPKIIGDAENED